eukprot:9932669-Heterocapsa_arctica.AAC.1
MISGPGASEVALELLGHGSNLRELRGGFHLVAGVGNVGRGGGEPGHGETLPAGLAARDEGSWAGAHRRALLRSVAGSSSASGGS